MRLLTHNFLKSNVKQTTNGYPLKIEPTEVIYEESPVDKVMVQKMCTKIDYSALQAAFGDIKNAAVSGTIEVDFELPDDLPESISRDQEDIPEDLIVLLHQVLFDIHVLNGEYRFPKGCMFMQRLMITHT